MRCRPQTRRPSARPSQAPRVVSLGCYRHPPASGEPRWLRAARRPTARLQTELPDLGRRV